MGRAKSYVERLFDFPDIGALAPPEAAIAISKPLEQLHGIVWGDEWKES
jgi:hypothetical protein